MNSSVHNTFKESLEDLQEKVEPNLNYLDRDEDIDEEAHCIPNEFEKY